MTKPRVTPNADQLRTATGSHTVVVPQQSDASDERIRTAVDAAEWITQENPEWGTEAGHLPAYNPLLGGDTLRDSDVWELTLNDFMEMAEDDQLAYFPQLGDTDFYNESNWTWLLDVSGQNAAPEEGARQGVEQWNSNL